MPLSDDVKSIADVIAKDLAAGQGTRQTVGSPTAAYGWIGGLPITLASFVATAKAAALSIPITRVTPSGTPVTEVAAGQPKPAAITITPATVNLVKHSGQATVNLEQTVDGGGMLAAIRSVLGAGSLLSFETNAMAVLAADKGQTATGADWSAAIVAGQAAVIGAGGNPGVAVVSYADYAELITAISGSAGFAQDPASPIGSYLGSVLHISSELATGFAYVLDPQSVMAVEHVQSPLLISDPFSGAGSNTIRLVSDLLAATVVMNPAHVCQVAIGVGARRGTAKAAA